MTANMFDFENYLMAVDRTRRNLSACETEVIANTAARLSQEDISHRARLENEGIQAIAKGDLKKADEILKRIEKLQKTGMKLVK